MWYRSKTKTKNCRPVHGQRIYILKCSVLTHFFSFFYDQHPRQVVGLVCGVGCKLILLTDFHIDLLNCDREFLWICKIAMLEHSSGFTTRSYWSFFLSDNALLSSNSAMMTTIPVAVTNHTISRPTIKGSCNSTNNGICQICTDSEPLMKEKMKGNVNSRKNYKVRYR